VRNEKPHFHMQDAEGMSPKELGERLFSGKYTIIGNSSKWRETHEAEYQAAKKESGRVDLSRREQVIAEHAKYQPQRKTYPEETLRARDKIPQAELDKFYKVPTVGYDLNKLKIDALAGDADAATKFYEIELSAYSHGVTSHPPTKIAVKPAEPSTFPVADALCDRYSLPRGTMVNENEFFEIVTTFADLQVEKEAEAAAKLAAEKVAA
jgi:hypothetical protein